MQNAGETLTDSLVIEMVLEELFVGCHTEREAKKHLANSKSLRSFEDTEKARTADNNDSFLKAEDNFQQLKSPVRGKGNRTCFNCFFDMSSRILE